MWEQINCFSIFNILSPYIFTACAKNERKGLVGAFLVWFGVFVVLFSTNTTSSYSSSWFPTTGLWYRLTTGQIPAQSNLSKPLHFLWAPNLSRFHPAAASQLWDFSRTLIPRASRRAEPLPRPCPAHLSGLDDREVVDVAEPCSHGRAQPGRAKGQPAAQAVPQLLVLPVLQQALNLLLGFLVLQNKIKLFV